MLKKITWCVLLSLFIISISAVSATDLNSTDAQLDEYEPVGEDIVSDVELADEISDSQTKSFSDLKNLIDSASDEDVIELNDDYTNDGSQSAININKKVTINGNGHILDGANASRIFTVSASDVTLNNITLINGKSSDGGAIFWSGSNGKLNSSHLRSNFASDEGGAIYWSGSSGKITNCNFDENTGTNFAGALYVSSSNTVVDKCNFTQNHLDSPYSPLGYSKGGGAIMWRGSYGTLTNSNFKNNKATGNMGSGGAIAWISNFGTFKNLTFDNNSAVYCAGAVILVGRSNNLDNITFINNHIESVCAGLNVEGNSNSITNSKFINNSASTGSGIYTQGSSNKITNCTFENNTARYGGAALSDEGSGIVDNCTFINNKAGNYGGAVTLYGTTVMNSNFINNFANNYGGAVYTYYSTLRNTNFTNCDDNNGIVIYSIYEVTGENLNIDNDKIRNDYNQSTFSITRGDALHLMNTNIGYYAYCAERYNLGPGGGILVDDFGLYRNSVTGELVGEYIKILLYSSINSYSDVLSMDLHNYVWEFTDSDFRNSDSEIVQKVVGLYDSGFRVKNSDAYKVLENGTLIIFDFRVAAYPGGGQNLVLFKFRQDTFVNQTVTKETLNQTVKLGDDVEFRITVNNTGNKTLTKVYVEDNDYSKGLKYKSWKNESGNWTYDSLSKRWILDTLEINKTASIILIFNTLSNGTLTNNVTSGFENIEMSNSSNKTTVYHPDMSVQKITNNATVYIGNQTSFTIIVKNTGDVKLGNIYVIESEYEGLIFDSYTGDNWIKNGNRFDYNGILNPGETASFIVIFNTSKTGNFTNFIIAGSNETENKTANNTTEIIEKNNFTNKTDVIEKNTTKITNKQNTTAEQENIFKNETATVKNAENKIYNSNATGNPILILLMCLMIIQTTRKRFNK